jgi:hypothetical protein
MLHLFTNLVQNDDGFVKNPKGVAVVSLYQIHFVLDGCSYFVNIFLLNNLTYEQRHLINHILINVAYFNVNKTKVIIITEAVKK